MKRKKAAALAAAVALALLLAGCEKTAPASTEQNAAPTYPGAHLLLLEGNGASLDGVPLKEFDRTWRADPSLPEACLEGTEPDADLAAYIAHDIIYYPEIPDSAFVQENYDGEREWVAHYTADGLQDYLFATLPVLGTELPREMMHTADEAYQNPVIHITQPGTYVIEGSFHGQLFFDFGDGDETFTDKAASVVVILNGAEVSCSVAPAIIFHDVYECDNTWESRESHSDITDLSEAGVKVVLADGTENSFTGCNVYRLLKPEYKKGSASVQKKLWKTDGAFYSFQSLSIDAEENGTGILNITGETFEGLDSELHLTVNGGYVNIFSQDDGINVNEDGVSVFTLNGGHLTVFAALGAEGDVIDSNGFIRIGGGVLAGTSKSPSDELLDSENGTWISDSAAVIYGGGMSADGRRGMPFDAPPMRPDGDFGDAPPMRPDGGFGEAPPDLPDGGFGEVPPNMPDGFPGNAPEPPERRNEAEKPEESA